MQHQDNSELSKNMINYRFIVLKVTLLFLTLVGVLSDKPVQIIDEESNSVDIEKIAEVVCKTTKSSDYQLSRISTINRLMEYFSNLPTNHDLSGCKNKYLNALTDIQSVIEFGNKDVCGDDKLMVIERFHRDYINSFGEQDKDNAIPKIMKIFFLHYASLISSTCSSSALIKLAKVLNPEVAENEDINAALQEYSKSLDFFAVFKSYDKVFLPWKLVDSFHLSESSSLSKYLHTGDIRLFISLHDTQNFAKFQAVCAGMMKPLYRQTLLPVLRLIDLGYYPEDADQLREKLRNDKSMKTLYTITQLCETIIPVYAVENKDLKPGQTVLLEREKIIGKVDEFVITLKEPTVELEQTNNSFELLDKLPTISASNAIDRTRNIKSNIRARSFGINQILKLIIKVYKQQASNGINQIFYGSVNKSEQLDSVVGESTIDEENPLSLDGSLGDDDEFKPIVRSKRSFTLALKIAGRIFWALTLKAIYFVSVLIGIVIGIVYLSILYLCFITPYKIFRFFTNIGYRPLERLLERAADVNNKNEQFLYEKHVRYVGKDKRIDW